MNPEVKIKDAGKMVITVLQDEDDASASSGSKPSSIRKSNIGKVFTAHMDDHNGGFVRDITPKAVSVQDIVTLNSAGEAPIHSGHSGLPVKRNENGFSALQMHEDARKKLPYAVLPADHDTFITDENIMVVQSENPEAEVNHRMNMNAGDGNRVPAEDDPVDSMKSETLSVQGISEVAKQHSVLNSLNTGNDIADTDTDGAFFNSAAGMSTGYFYDPEEVSLQIAEEGNAADNVRRGMYDDTKLLHRGSGSSPVSTVYGDEAVDMEMSVPDGKQNQSTGVKYTGISSSAAAGSVSGGGVESAIKPERRMGFSSDQMVERNVSDSIPPEGDVFAAEHILAEKSLSGGGKRAQAYSLHLPQNNGVWQKPVITSEGMLVEAPEIASGYNVSVTGYPAEFYGTSASVSAPEITAWNGREQDIAAAILQNGEMMTSKGTHHDHGDISSAAAEESELQYKRQYHVVSDGKELPGSSWCEEILTLLPGLHELTDRGDFATGRASGDLPELHDILGKLSETAGKLDRISSLIEKFEQEYWT